MGTHRRIDIELMRGFLMLMIVGLHVLAHSILVPGIGSPATSINLIIGNLLFSLCVMAVNCFILISGFFGIRANYKKFFNLILPIIFYSVIIYVGVTLYYHSFSLSSLAKSFFPIRSGGYWFVASYVILFLISPLINICLDRLTKQNLLFILIIGYMVFVVYPSFTPFSLTADRGHGIISFMLLYCTGRYIKICEIHKGGWLYPTAVLFIFIANTVQLIIEPSIGHMTHFNAYDNIFVYMAAIGFFMLFTKLNIKGSWVSYLSPSFFYIYVIHENNYIRPYIYDLLGCGETINSPYWILYTIGVMVLIFCICLLIDIIRRILLGQLFDIASQSCALHSKRIVDWLQYKMERFIRLYSQG